MSLLDAMVPLHTSAYWGGPGYIAGESPDGLTLVDGVPTVCEIRVHERATGRLVSRVLSNADGTYVIHRLNPALLFDVVCRELTGTWGDRLRYAVRPEPY